MVTEVNSCKLNLTYASVQVHRFPGRFTGIMFTLCWLIFKYLTRSLYSDNLINFDLLSSVVCTDQVPKMRIKLIATVFGIEVLHRIGQSVHYISIKNRFRSFMVGIWYEPFLWVLCVPHDYMFSSKSRLNPPWLHFNAFYVKQRMVYLSFNNLSFCSTFRFMQMIVWTVT